MTVGSGGALWIAVAGGTRWTNQAWLAGVGSTLPAASVARASKTCAPCFRPESGMGESQPENAEPSTLHSKVHGGVEQVKAKLALGAAAAAGGASVMVVSGGVRSTRQLASAGVGSARPPATARTSKRWPASARSPTVSGEAQGAKAAPSSAHSKPAGRSAWKAKVAVVEAVGEA